MSDNDIKIVVAERLRKIRGEETQERFSTKCGIEFETYRKIEQKTITLSIENAIKISKKYNISLDYIYGMSEDINKKFSSINLLIENIDKIQENIVEELSFYNKLIYTSTINITLYSYLHQLLIDIGKIKETNLSKELEQNAIQTLELEYNKKITESKEKGIKLETTDYILFPQEKFDIYKLANIKKDQNNTK